MRKFSVSVQRMAGLAAFQKGKVIAAKWLHAGVMETVSYAQ